jgi:hypothetical protein
MEQTPFSEQNGFDGMIDLAERVQWFRGKGKNNDEGYSPNNCVLACYYCNNDKSYITNGDDYKINFGKNRKKYFRMLMNK